MTKTTEELKREMYRDLENLKRVVIGSVNHAAIAGLEESLEEYLEALRKDSKTDVRIDSETQRDNEILRDAYIRQQDLTMQARSEADTERNRAQAFEYANKSAGEFLQEARTKIKSQRQSIGQLKNERDNAVHALKVKESKLQKALEELSELRKVVGSTVAQNRAESVACNKCGGTGRELIGMHTQHHAPVTVPCFKCATGFGAKDDHQ